MKKDLSAILAGLLVCGVAGLLFRMPSETGMLHFGAFVILVGGIVKLLSVGGTVFTKDSEED